MRDKAVDKPADGSLSASGTPGKYNKLAFLNMKIQTADTGTQKFVSIRICYPVGVSYVLNFNQGYYRRYRINTAVMRIRSR